MNLMSDKFVKYEREQKEIKKLKEILSKLEERESQLHDYFKSTQKAQSNMLAENKDLYLFNSVSPVTLGNKAVKRSLMTESNKKDRKEGSEVRKRAGKNKRNDENDLGKFRTVDNRRYRRFVKDVGGVGKSSKENWRVSSVGSNVGGKRRKLISANVSNINTNKERYLDKGISYVKTPQVTVVRK